MTEPDIIHSIPEGSHVAVSKTGTPQEPSVHKNYRAGGGEDIPLDIPDRMSPASPVDRTNRMTPGEDAPLSERTDLAKTHLNTQADARAMVPPPPAQQASVVMPPSRTSADTSFSNETVQVSSAQSDSKHVNAVPEGAVMPEMYFPARVVHLRIENEQLRTRLEKLDADR
jgi:hypothetical protein